MQKGGGLSVDEGYDIVVDGSGNTFTTGYFTGTANFGSTSLSSSGNSDIFVAKVNDQGVHQWAVKAGGSGADRGNSIEIDASGNVYITGYFSGTATFGSSTVTSAGLQDVFIAKYNSSGTLQWVKSAGGTDADIGNGIDVDGSGNVVVTGEFKGTATFGTTSLTSQSSTIDVFITKLSSSGAFSWTKQGAGGDTDRGLDVGVDNSGNIYTIGQFSNNITFDVLHANTMYNVVFLVKYNSSGTEQWFRIIGGGSSNIANAIATDGSGNCYITGDFTGSLTFYGSPNTTITNSYSDKFFIAKYSSSGAVQWATSKGSDNDITSQSVAFDASGNSYVTGHFKCSLDEFSDTYGEGTFNSVGYQDIFISKFNSSGVWQFAKHIGGREDDYGYGIAALSGNAHITGSFKNALNIPVSSDFIATNLSNWTDVSCNGNSPYCNDQDYGEYYAMDASGNSDVLIANCFDPDREPYDFYPRSGSGCTRDQYNPLCLNAGCPDTVSNCNAATLVVQPALCSAISPDLTYTWSPGAIAMSPSTSAMAPSEGYYWVNETSADGCFSEMDSIYVEILAPDKPRISDDVVVNTKSLNPQPVNLCNPDTVLLTGSNYGQNTYFWTGPGIGAVFDSLLSVSTTGTYSFHVTNPEGCTATTVIDVIMHDSLGPFQLAVLVDDTVQICEGEQVVVTLYDTIGNPTANPVCLNLLGFQVSSTWTVTPSVSPPLISCETYLYITAGDTGYYTIDVMFIRENPCNSDTHYLSKTFYIEPMPAPASANYNLQITGSSYFCPGDSTLLVATGAINYEWYGPGFVGQQTDSIMAYLEGDYIVFSSTSDTNQYGCIANYNESKMIHVQEKPQPQIIASELLICPNDSVLLTCTNSGAWQGSFYWEGPNGPLQGNNNMVYVSTPGSYYCQVIDSDSCNLLSNTVTLSQYTTPALSVSGDPVICENDSMVISVVANENSIIEWQNPAGSSSPSVTVYGPGTYVCKITSCNIESIVSITVVQSDVFAEITPSGPLCIGETITLSGNPGMAGYKWSSGNKTTQDITIGKAGTYTLTTTDSNGCSAVSDPLTVTIDQVPTVISLDGYTTFCEGDSVELVGNSNMKNYLWDPSGDTTQTLIVHQPGEYALTTIDTNGCEGRSKPIELFTPGPYAPVEFEGEFQFCEGDFITFWPTAPGLHSAIWSPVDDTVFSFAAFESGDYSVTTIDTFGCLAWSDTFSVFVQENNLTDPLVRDTIICAGEDITLSATSNLGTLNWYDEGTKSVVETGNSLLLQNVKNNTTFLVYSEHIQCTSGVSPVTVRVKDCQSISIPNIFTPNGDGVNDVFRPELIDHTCFHGKIFNRWGRLIYELNENQDVWDGTIQSSGEQVAHGVYYYLIEYCRHDLVVKEHRGSVTVLHN